MDTVRNLEKQAAGWYKQLPHLPAEVRAWLANNAWWLVLVGVVLLGLSLFALIPLVLTALGLSAILGASLLGSYGYTNGMAWISTLFALVTAVVTLVLFILAVSPLKAKSKKGWSLLFLSLLVALVFDLASDVVNLSIFGIVTSLLWAAVEGYFLFEIRDEFGRKVAPKHAADAPAAKK